MRKIVLVSISFVILLFACTPKEQSDNEKTKTNPPTPEVQVQTKPELSEDEIDSLKFTYNLDLEDGLYRVARSARSPANVLPIEPYEKLIAFEKSMVYDEEDPYWLVIDRLDYVPLILNEEPSKNTTDHANTMLMLSLHGAATAKLAKFTTKNVNEEVAVIIGNKGWSRHKVREPITGGKLQISRCTDNACETLFVELQDNVLK